mgnify:CR=1 FL=1
MTRFEGGCASVRAAIAYQEVAELEVAMDEDGVRRVQPVHAERRVLGHLHALQQRDLLALADDQCLEIGWHLLGHWRERERRHARASEPEVRGRLAGEGGGRYTPIMMLLPSRVQAPMNNTTFGWKILLMMRTSSRTACLSSGDWNMLGLNTARARERGSE